jgi:hypothetical protein
MGFNLIKLLVGIGLQLCSFCRKNGLTILLGCVEVKEFNLVVLRYSARRVQAPLPKSLRRQNLGLL